MNEGKCWDCEAVGHMRGSPECSASVPKGVSSANAATIISEQFQTFCFVAQHNDDIEQETTLSVVIQGNNVGEGYLGDSEDLEEGEVSPGCVECTYTREPEGKSSFLSCTDVEEGEISNPYLTYFGHIEFEHMDVEEAFYPIVDSGSEPARLVCLTPSTYDGDEFKLVSDVNIILLYMC
jgi:hypothetical protein